MSRRMATGAALEGGRGCSEDGRAGFAGEPTVSGGMGWGVLGGILVRADPRPMFGGCVSSGIRWDPYIVKIWFCLRGCGADTIFCSKDVK